MDPALRVHLKSCRASGWPCRSFATDFEAWSAQPPLHPAHPEETWLWFEFAKNNDGHEVLNWRCLACGESSCASAQYHNKSGGAKAKLRLDSFRNITTHLLTCGVWKPFLVWTLVSKLVMHRQCLHFNSSGSSLKPSRKVALALQGFSCGVVLLLELRPRSCSVC